MMNTDNSLKSLLKDLITEITELVRQEMRLAQAEASEKVHQAQYGLIAVLAGMLLAFSALLILLQAVVVALAEHMPAWAASVIVGGVVALIALFLVKQGQANLTTNLTPERTLASIRRDKDMVMEKVT